jgi:hypothetical protein
VNLPRLRAFAASCADWEARPIKHAPGRADVIDERGRPMAVGVPEDGAYAWLALPDLLAKHDALESDVAYLRRKLADVGAALNARARHEETMAASLRTATEERDALRARLGRTDSEVDFEGEWPIAAGGGRGR